MRERTLATSKAGMVVLAAVLSVACVAKGPLFQPAQFDVNTQVVVYLYRPAVGFAAAHMWEISANGHVVTTLIEGGYFPYVTSPGKVQFALKESREAPVALDVMAGRYYYVKLHLWETFNPFKASFNYELISVEGQDAADVMQCRLLEPAKE